MLKYCRPCGRDWHITLRDLSKHDRIHRTTEKTPGRYIRPRSRHISTRCGGLWQSARNIRLLEVDTFRLSTLTQARLESPHDYAILSHTWNLDADEISFQDMTSRRLQHTRYKDTFTKIQYVNDQAKKDGLQYFWVDTCCIDKSSSAELSEAINSMYHWYASAAVCYVYLCDVDNSASDAGFSSSRWFTRAWTLQELLAPNEVRFYDRFWTFLGTLSDLVHIIADITGIDENILLHKSELRDYSISQRMSWAADRQATRVEDRAYSLLGIFDINMPMLYGEGEKAFARLQEEIIHVTMDHTIFCWEHGSGLHQRLLAPSPSSFTAFKAVVPMTDRAPRPYQLTNRGLEISLPIQSYTGAGQGRNLTLAKLDCVSINNPDQTLALRLEREYDLDAEDVRGFKPWTGLLQRRTQEAWDNLMGRDFDWHFVASFARRGFSIGHWPDKRRLEYVNNSNVGFREQTIVILRRRPSDTRAHKTKLRGSSNPLSKFNELTWAASVGLYGLMSLPASLTLVVYFSYSG